MYQKNSANIDRKLLKMGKRSFIYVRCLTATYMIIILFGVSPFIHAANLVSVAICENVTKIGSIPVGIKDKFIPQTPNIHAVAVLKNLKKDTKIRGSWIAVNTTKPPNYQISFEETLVKKDGNATVHFTVPRPAKGWPPGNYRFDLYINGNLYHTVPFSIISDFQPKAPVSFDLGPVQKDSQRQWTLVVYMGGDNNLEPFVLKDLDEMERAIPGKGIEIIALVDRAEGFNDDEGDWKDTRIFRVRPDRQQGIKSEMLSTPGEQNLGDPSVLSAFLSSALKTFPARRYALILWNHGSGWAGHVTDDTAPGTPQNFDKLTLPELRTAITGALQNVGLKKIDLIGFDMCLMAQMETAYELKDLADVMVGSEAIEPNDGWPYEAIIPIFSNPAIPTKQVAKRIVDAYHDHYRLSQESMTTQSAFDLKVVGETLNALDNVVNKLNDRLKLTWPTVSRSLFFSESYAARTEVQRGKNALASIDLMDALNRLRINMKNFPANSEYDALVTSMDKFVLASQTSPARRLSTGVAIYAPITGSRFNSAYRLTRFSKTSRWNTFLDNLHKLQETDKSTPVIRDLQLVNYAGNQIIPINVARPLSTHGILYTVEGKNLLWLRGNVGERTEDGKGMLIHTRSTVLDANWHLRSKEMAADQVDFKIPEYIDGVNQRIIVYSGYRFAVSNGKHIHYATIDMPLGQGFMSIPVIFTHPGIGTLRGMVFFKPHWWKSSTVVLLVPQKDGTLLYRQVEPAPDAEITTLFEVMTDTGEIRYLRGGTMKWGEGLELLLSLYPAGTYEVALTAEAINGRSKTVFFEFPAEEHSIVKQKLQKGSTYSAKDLIGVWSYISPEKYRNENQIVPMGLKISFSRHPRKKGLLVSELTKPNNPNFRKKFIVLLDTRMIPHLRMFPVQDENISEDYLTSNTSSVYLTEFFSTPKGSPVMLMQNILNLRIYMAVKR